MKKFVLFSVVFSCLLGVSTLLAALPRLGKSASNVKKTAENVLEDAQKNIGSAVEAITDEISKSTKDTDKKEEGNLATLPNGKAYVGVSSYLALRDEPFGEVLAELGNNEEIEIVDRKGDWYEIDSDKGSGWVYAKCVFDKPNSRSTNVATTTNTKDDDDNDKDKDTVKSTTKTNNYKYVVFNDPTDNITLTNTSSSKSKVTSSEKNKGKKKVTSKKNKKNKNKKNSKKKNNKKKNNNSKKSKLQKKIVKEANKLVKKYSKSGSFPYDSNTCGGRYGCAQVATTVLKNAGALNSINLSCEGTEALLKKAGWKKVKVPPYQAGDVIFWKGTQGSRKSKNAPSHVGIIMESGNNVQAMSNSSSQKRPRLHSATYQTLYGVYRKA